jgi:NADPH-dependent 2,4-dienoyl-CoA reductase/sulfur reductase-like enzyme
VIVGGGLIGIEMAEMLHSRHIPVTMIVRESGYGSNILPREESEMVSAHIRAHDIELLLNEELGEIRQKDGRVSSVLCQHSGREIECDFVGLTVGVSPQVEWVRHSGILLNKGIVVDEYLRTSDPDIYAIGDCAEINNPQPGRRPVEAVWYTGRLMGETVAKTICGQPTPYDPGIWFNSAKYFDIEYQVYGDIPIHLPDFITSLYWQHPTENKAIRIHYNTVTGAVTGFNLMGIRYRQAVCEKWITDKTHIEEVLAHLSWANFDPEFSTEYEKEILSLYNRKEGKSLSLTSERSLSGAVRFLNKSPENS